jgi:serine/threonine protein phosphatase PrpC
VTKPSLRIAACSDAGHTRTHQEDCSLVGVHNHAWEWGAPDSICYPDVLGALMAVADGLGGHNAGEVASRLAMDGLRDYFSSLPPAAPSSDEQTYRLLAEAILHANTLILDHTSRNPETAGMGTTVVVSWLLGSIMHLAWSGDSRCYLWRAGQPVQPLQQLSRDHSFRQHLIDKGVLSPEEAMLLPEGHALLQCLGGSGYQPTPDYRSLPVQPGDRILLCSDGLHNLLTDMEIADLLGQSQVYTCARQLVDTANQAGGYDNITVVIGEVVS